MRLLLVEDNRGLSEMVADHLRKAGFAVDAMATAEEAFAAMAVAQYDGIILDLGLPGADGMTVLEKARNGTALGTPVLILTARDGLESRLKGLNAGADDYLVKPFNLLELEARLRAVLRRPGRRRSDLLEYGDLTFNVPSCEVRVNDRPVDLARREFALLEELMRAAPQIVIKDQLEDRLYAFHERVTPNAIEAIVSRLRKKIQTAGGKMRIVTVRGVGYKLVLGADDGVDQ